MTCVCTFVRRVVMYGFIIYYYPRLPHSIFAPSFSIYSGAECGEGLLETCHEGHNEDHDHEVEGAATASNGAATATNGDGDHDEDHDEDHDSHDAEEAHDDHDEDHDDHDEDHSSHDGHGHDHSDEVKTMSKDPSSATIRRVVVAALALAAGSMIIA